MCEYVWIVFTLKNIFKISNWLHTDDGKERCSHEERVQNTHNASDGYLDVRLSYETDDDVEDGRNACDDDRECSSESEDKLESTCEEKKSKE